MIKEFSKGPQRHNTIAEQLKQVKPENLIKIFKESPHTLMKIMVIAGNCTRCKTPSYETDNIEKDDLIKILKNHHIR